MRIHRPLIRTAAIALVAACVLVPGSLAHGDAGLDARTHGEIREVGSLRVLRIWGTAKERGYAHGYFLGDEIVRLLNGYLEEITPGEEGAKLYEQKARAMLRTMAVAPRFKEELEGMLSGIRAKLPDGGYLSRLGRAIEYDDLVTINCIPEISRVACSSFAAWGPLTKDGDTISGRNLDWHSLRALEGGQILLVQIPDASEAQIAWVSVTWPGFIGCLTGMNAEGVSVCMHDVHSDEPSMPIGFTPRGLSLRQVIESAHAETAAKDGRHILSKCLSRVGNNVVLSAPYLAGRSRPSIVFEYDGRMFDSSGVTVRAAKVAGEKKGDRAFQIATNHYRKRAEPEPCDRYARINEQLNQMSKASKRLNVDGAWRLLASVAQEAAPGKRGLLTYHSVVFEPNARRMHVAISRDGKPAPHCPVVAIDLADLLQSRSAQAAGN